MTTFYTYPEPTPFSSARPVRYIDQMPSLFDEEALIEFLALEGHHTSDSDRIFDEVIWTKSNHWAHEREWRVYAGVGETVAAYEDVAFAATELDGVIFGLRIAEEDMATVADLIQAKYPHAKSFQAKAKQNAYELVITSFAAMARRDRALTAEGSPVHRRPYMGINRYAGLPDADLAIKGEINRNMEKHTSSGTCPFRHRNVHLNLD